MKRNIILILVTLSLANLKSPNSFAQQAQLYIDQVDSLNAFLPNDTVFEGGSPYNFNIRVRNFDPNPSAPNASLKIYLRNTDSTALTQPEQLLDSSIFIASLSGNDTINVPINGYNFTQATYRAGNNIVVVWPRLGSNVATTYDSLQLDTIYFVLLSSVNMISAQNDPALFFPNPVISEIIINKNDKKSIEYVRILNDIGQEILHRRTFENHLDVRFLSEGFYFIEIKERNGTISRRKFLKL